MAEWISVNDRLPEDYVPVLAYVKHIDGKRAVFLVDHVIDYTNGCKTWAETDTSWKYCVSHWMPLPEPPKEVENGN